MPKWTQEQQQAIDARNRTILVSAAAGSGKTAVLIERIVQLIREGARVNRMLIVTFTKAAAGEMRQRLNKRLVHEAAMEPETFSQALDDLEATEISTIHAFCQKALRNYFHVVGIDPLVRACDEQLRQNLFRESWLEAFNELLEKKEHPGFMSLADAWEQQQLMDVTAQLHDFLMSLPAPFRWMEEAIRLVTKKPYDRHPWFVTLRQHVRLMLGGVELMLQNMRNLLDEPDAIPQRMSTWQSDCCACETLRALTWNPGEDTLGLLQAFKLEKMPVVRGVTAEQKEWQKRFTAERDEIKKLVKNAVETLNIDEERLDREFSAMQNHLLGLQALVTRTDEVFLRMKAEKHVIDFSDMEQFTMQVLSDPESRSQIQAEYDHIFVDECQDVSQVQDAILHAIHCEDNCMFMVGDVKQSIYRFRKADPTLFLHRLRTYPQDEGGKTRKIILQKNFRSRKCVLEATNQVFRETMRPNVTELSYDAEDELICGRATENDPPVEMHLLDVSPGEDGEKPEALAAEAAVVVERIRELLEEEFDDGNGLRKYTYRDMVILLSAASNTAPRLVELLTAQGIPVYYDGASAFFTLQEVQAVKAILSVIDNPRQDVALLAAMKAPPFAFTDEELGLVRLCKTGQNVPYFEAFESCCQTETHLGLRCREFRRQMAEWRFQADVMRLSDFVWQVIHDSGFYAACGARPKGELRQANLRMLYQRAVEFEENGGETLSELLTLMDQQASADDRTTAKILGENENLVRIMTMHKSKGLEFPVVFCMQMSGRLHKPSRSHIQMHPALGLALPYVNREMSIRRKTLADEAFRVRRELDEKAERARLLYVAMTRARERLILVGCCTEKERKIWALPESDYRVWKASSMTDWIMQGRYAQFIHNLSTEAPPPATPWHFRFYDHVEPLKADVPVDNIDALGWLMREAQSPMETPPVGWDGLKVQEPPVPLKTSVSAIAKQAAVGKMLPEGPGEEDASTKRVPEEITNPLRLSELPSAPAFLTEKRLTGAERGTLLHRLLSLIPLDELRVAEDLLSAVQQAAHHLMERGVFTPQELLLMDMAGAAEFFASKLGQRMLASANVRREWGFNLLLPENHGAMLQGVIDCAFMEEGRWVLVDYKTDHIQDFEAFRQCYALQLEWYARALERITGQPVGEMWLYAIGPRRACAMERVAK